MKINSEDFRVREASEVSLKNWATRIAPVYGSNDEYQELLKDHVKKLSAQQELLYASGRYAVLLIFQAMDAAGKDGVIAHVMSGVNPQGCQVFSFKHPSAMELQHDFLWRTTRDLPERGKIGIFNRSYYEEVLIVRVHPEILHAQGLPDALIGSRKDRLARPLPIHPGPGTASASQRHPHHQILPAPLERRAAQALPRTNRRSGKELEVQHGGHRRA